MSMTFVAGVSRLLRQNSYLSHDDTDVTAFSDTQHKAAIKLAIIAIQSTLNELIADTLIPFERVDGTITFVDGTRVYALPDDFIRFADSPPFMLQLDASGNSENRHLYQYGGGVARLSRDILDYREQGGTPVSWYMVDDTTEKVGFWQVPDSTVDALDVRFSYEKEIMVTVEADVLPFSRTSMDYAFVDMAARRYEFMKMKEALINLPQDAIYASSKTTLTNLMNYKDPAKKYGYSYR